MVTEVKKVPIPPRGVDYRGKLVLAPMVRSGELPSRLMALHYGADLVWSPETVDRAMIGTTRLVNERTGTIDFVRKPSNGAKDKSTNTEAKDSIIFRLHPEREGKKLIFQVGTADPERAVEAARIVAPDVAGIDVNAGCPKPFSTSGGMGAALLKTPEKLASILEALVKNITPEFGIGISVKIRLLDDPENTEALVRRLCATGITGLTIHCRTTPMRPRQPAIRSQLSMIRNVCHEAGVACLVNGDVLNRDQMADLVEEFGVDGAMIARAAEENPSCFRTEADGGMAHWSEISREYLRMALEVDNKFTNTKYLLAQMVPGKEHETYSGLIRARNYLQLVDAFGYAELRADAEDLDAHLGLSERETGKVDRHRLEKINKINHHNQTADTVAAAAGKSAEVRKEERQKKKSALSERGVSSAASARGNKASGAATGVATATVTASAAKETSPMPL
ncbi:tRNA-dihydrouridine(20) synthase [NAD(P)+] [Ceratocystis fimbriata CBS 114723]|uniref:tRNA-dihydrouridine(20) synthase [NAD(P)+] n=1 Tax=Ceratocystis fimbriata CBS 114723 TaxID=1035309 RepID=A0A2C5X3W5_9PEZI|nr:tRNA-dihydrouridine(20) synthase [NAD(P)+] [Ceratocystis fimbriata CBS 114723]